MGIIAFGKHVLCVGSGGIIEVAVERDGRKAILQDRLQFREIFQDFLRIHPHGGGNGQRILARLVDKRKQGLLMRRRKTLGRAGNPARASEKGD
jgi:hypothetical protein